MDATKLTAQEQEQEKRNSAFGATLYSINAVIGSSFPPTAKRFIKDLVTASHINCHAWNCPSRYSLAVCLAEAAGYFNRGAFQYSKQPLELSALM